VKSRWSSTTTTRIVPSPSLLKNLFTLSAQDPHKVLPYPLFTQGVVRQP
jgi:hypothetical protein